MVDTPEWMRCGLKTFQIFLKWAPNAGIPLAQDMTMNRAMYNSYCANLWPPLPPPAGPTDDRNNPSYHAAPNGAQFQPNLPLRPAVDQSRTPDYAHVDRPQLPAGVPSNFSMGQPQSPCYPAFERARLQTGIPSHQGQPPATGHCRHSQSVNTPNVYYNAAVPAQKTWLGPQSTSQFPHKAIISMQDAGNVYQGTQKLSNNAIAPAQNDHNVYPSSQHYFNNAALVQNAGNIGQATHQYSNNAAPVHNAHDVCQGSQPQSNNAAPLQNVGNVCQGIQQLSNNAIAPVQNAGNVYQGTPQRPNNAIDPMQGITYSHLKIASSTMPDTRQSSIVPAAASAFNIKDAKALEKAVEKKAKDYDLDTATTRQLKAYANAREKGIEASEPEDAVSQHIIYEFQAVRERYPALTTWPECLPGNVCLLPGQKQYNRRGERSKEYECKIVRDNLHKRNRDRWRAAAAPPPMGRKPQGIIKASPVKQRKTTLQAPSLMQVSDNLIYAIPHQSYSAPAYSTMDQTMCSQFSNFTSPTTVMPAMASVADCRPSSSTHLSTVLTALTPSMGTQSFDSTDNTTRAPAMTPFLDDETSHSTSSSEVPTGLTLKWGNRVWSVTELSEEPLQPMPAIGNEPSGPATPPIAPPIPIQTTSNEIQQPVTPPIKAPTPIQAISNGIQQSSASPITPPIPLQATSTELREPAVPAVTPPKRRHETCTFNSGGVLCREGVKNVPCHSGSFFPTESNFKPKKPQGAINTTIVAPKMDEIVAKGPTDTATETPAVTPTTNLNAGNEPINFATDIMPTLPILPPVEFNDPINTFNQMIDTNTEETPDADGGNRQLQEVIASLFEEDLEGLAEGLEFWPEVIEECEG
ncbi:hypothetical protein N7G274_003887 [Stereocaulon virgatum]|uniref:Uncharacterized protein n=1 Tax=Stereocaulon virgatum TaxID=373712 RepID=A0ABR4ACU7_9LECA